MRWETEEAGVPPIVDGALDEQRVEVVVSAREARRLGHVDERTLRAGLLGANEVGLFVPRIASRIG